MLRSSFHLILGQTLNSCSALCRSLKTAQNVRNFAKEVTNKLAAVGDVEIEEGLFKYVLIKVKDKNASKNIVRGYTDCKWHSDIYQRVNASLQKMGLESQCLGGGRIEHNSQNKYVKIYGTSQGYGKADHAESRNILKQKYGDYQIEISNL